METYPQINLSVADHWWTGLTVEQKIQIASKASSKLGYAMTPSYPRCTFDWNNLTLLERQGIHDHCLTAHGMETPEWQEGHSFSY